MTIKGSMNTFDTNIFIIKTAHDIGGLSASKPGSINLIPSMPGMGVITSIQERCKILEREARIKTQVVTLDHIVGGGEIDTGNTQVLVVDVGSAAITTQEQEALVDFSKAASKNSSVWLVGGDTDALSRALDNKATRFQNTLRGWRDRAAADNNKLGGKMSP